MNVSVYMCMYAFIFYVYCNEKISNIAVVVVVVHP